MKKKFTLFLLFLFSIFPLQAGLRVGVGRTDMTPPIGTPSAGYFAPERKMIGVHDPLLATAVVVDNGEQTLAFCAVDHLGFDFTMVQEVKEAFPQLTLFLGSSHTHSGAGAYLDLPIIGEMLAGPFNPLIRQFLVDQAVDAIEEALQTMQEAQMGVGYGSAPGLTRFRSTWPEEVIPSDALTVIQFSSLKDKPLATLFNFAIHPTVLPETNTVYSADCIGFARTYIERHVGGTALYFNGAQGDIGPNPPDRGNEYQKCQYLGRELAKFVIATAREMTLDQSCSIAIKHVPYTFEVQPTSQGLSIPISEYQSELNLLVLNQEHAFVTVPGELSCVYAKRLEEQSPYSHTSIFGLTNDAHGYIITPDAFKHKTYESTLSFGGENYGEWVFTQLLQLLQEDPFPQLNLCRQKL